MLKHQLCWKHFLIPGKLSSSRYDLKFIRRARSWICTDFKYCDKLQHLLPSVNKRPVVSIHAQCCASFSTKSPSASAEDVIENEEAFADLESDLDPEFSTVVGGTEDEVQHFRINLHPNLKDPILAQLCDASSVVQVFEIMESIPPELKTEKHTSQALVTIWDLQKFLYRIGPIFDPQRDFSSRHIFVENLTKHPSFNDIFQHVISHAHLLEDEPLVASLLCLKKMNWSMKSPESQILIEECLKRKNSLTLPALSRFCVCMKTEGIYGSLAMIDFLPLIIKFIREMDDDLSVRLVSISVRNMSRALPPSVIQLYRKKVSELLANPFCSITYCKILTCLLETRNTASPTDESSSQYLMREVGKLATPFVSDMDLMQILSLQYLLEFGPHEPRKFITAVHSRISRYIEEQEEMPRMDLIACISPFIKRSSEQKRRLASYAHEYLISYENFDQISHILLKILRVIKIKDRGLYDKYWSKALQQVNVESMDTRKILKLAHDYLSFNFGMGYFYRHEEFEACIKRVLYFYVENYRNQTQPCMISPGDFGRAYAFLIAFGTPQDPMFQEHRHGFLRMFETNFAYQCRVQELAALARGVSTSLFYQNNNLRTPKQYFDQIMDFSSIIEGTISTKLLEERSEELTTGELVSISKLHLTIKRAFGDSPLFQESVARWTTSCSPMTLDSKLGREMAVTLMSANYNAPAVFTLLQEFIWKNSESVTAEVVSKFLSLAYTIGYEPETSQDASIFNTCYEILER